MSKIPEGFLSPGMSKVALIVFPVVGQVKYIFVMGVTNYTFVGSNRAVAEHFRVSRAVRRRDDALRRFLCPKPSSQSKAAIAKRFKVLRRKARITQATLGHVIGISRQAVNEIENRRVYPHYTTIDRFSDLEKRHENGRHIAASLYQPFEG